MWQFILPEVTEGFLRCAVCPSQWTRPMMIRCGLAVNRMWMLGVSVRKVKALRVKIEIVTLIGKGR